MKYLPSHNAYLTASVAHPDNRMAYSWAPHPWGPFYPVGTSDCTENAGSYASVHGCVPFWALMDYGENVISTNPPKTQIRLSGKTDHDSGNGEGSPGFWTVEAVAGRAPIAGAARRADYMGSARQMGMGHRFVSGNEAGAMVQSHAGGADIPPIGG
jgi:hypothetical protein